MRLYHSLSLAALLLIYLSGECVLGAPTKGERLQKCKEVDKNGKCIEMFGSKIDSDGLYPFAQRVASDKSSEEVSEQSGDGSGFDSAAVEQEESNHIKESEEESEEESSADNSFIDNEIMPWKQHSRLSDQELQMDNMIQ